VSATVTVFSDTALGTYVARACVDSDEVVPEGVESNNCTESSDTVTVVNLPLARPDLVVTALTDPPDSILPRGTFEVSATVMNQGTAAIGVSATRFFLKSTAGPVRKNLMGQQGVPELDPDGSASPAAVTVELFSDTAAGIYVLEACADGPDDFRESDDANNCRSTTATIEVLEMPDLVVTDVSSPPASASTGDTFSVTSTVQNIGDVDAPASSAKFYLRSTTAPHPRKDLRGTLDVPVLAPGQTFTDQLDVTVQTGTASGAYQLQGCADSGKDIVEEDEDNCTIADGTIQVQAIALPDLVVQTLNVKDPPVTVAPGGTFVVRGKVGNVGTGDAGETTLRYWLVPVAGGALKNLQGSKAVPAVPAGMTSDTIRRQVTVFSDTVPGSYRIRACVDPQETLTEVSDGNNCKVSNAVVTVQ
jgi:subtilase family serine protease